MKSCCTGSAPYRSNPGIKQDHTDYIRSISIHTRVPLFTRHQDLRARIRIIHRSTDQESICPLKDLCPPVRCRLGIGISVTVKLCRRIDQNYFHCERKLVKGMGHSLETFARSEEKQQASASIPPIPSRWRDLSFGEQN